MIYPHLGVSSNQAVALQIEKNALVKMLNIEDAITAALENFYFVVETFDKTTRLSMNEEIGNLIQPEHLTPLSTGVRRFRPLDDIIYDLQEDKRHPTLQSKGVVSSASGCCRALLEACIAQRTGKLFASARKERCRSMPGAFNRTGLSFHWD